MLALPDFLERAAALAQGPECAIHVRGRLAADRLLLLADTLRRVTAETGTRLLIHDRLDIAVLCGADGVHLPAAGIPTPRARDALGRAVLIGRSVHSAAEARAAMGTGNDYVILGNIWETASHPGRAGLGPGAITAARCAGVIAIGGITPATAPQAARAGATGVAAIRGLWDAPDPAAAARAMRVLFIR